MTPDLDLKLMIMYTKMSFVIIYNLYTKSLKCLNMYFKELKKLKCDVYFFKITSQYIVQRYRPAGLSRRPEGNIP